MKRRKITIRDSERELRGQKGPNGYRLCRWCKKEVQPPKKTFCGDDCVHNWKLRSNPGYLREHTYKRDLGVCAGCGSDTRLQKIQLENALKICGYNEKAELYRVLLVALNVTANEARRSLWQADHVVPVAAGGGLCDLSNIQTLCTRCHKLKTGIQAGASAKPRKIKVMKMQPMGLKGLKGFSGKIED